MDEGNKKQRKTRKPGQWRVLDVLMGIFGIVALFALAVAGFKVAKWVIASYF
jgi:hypothetical protein